MAAVRERYEVADSATDKNGQLCFRLDQTLTVPGVTDSIALSDEVTLSLTGTATSFVAIMERSPSGDAGTFAWADDATFTGNLATGFPIRRYYEPTKGHWRLNVSTLTGGNIVVHISGLHG